MNNNQLTGNIPNFNLPALHKLWLSHNQLSGVIPNFTGMDNLKELYLSWNKLTSVQNLQELTQIEKLALHQNLLNCPMPNFTLPLLKELYMHNNQLTGPIPSLSVANLPVLNTLWLQNNQLSGCLPTNLRDFCTTGHVTSGDISNNLFTHSWADLCAATPPIGVICGISLSAELTTFTAHPLSKNVQLNWQTASEKNNDHFDIERSTDGKTFSKIGEQKGQGTTSQVQNYGYLDTNPFSGVNYYRLKQVDVDGQFTYSKTVSVEMGKTGKSISVYPNPVKDKLMVETTIQGDYTIDLFDITGKLLQSYKANQPLMSLTINDLPNGVYMVSIKSNAVQQTFKIVKQ